MLLDEIVIYVYMKLKLKKLRLVNYLIWSFKIWKILIFVDNKISLFNMNNKKVDKRVIRKLWSLDF